MNNKGLAHNNPNSEQTMTGAQKKTWVKALRSGRYEQGRGRLVTVDHTTGKKGYCCLGVAQKVCRLKSTSRGFLRNNSGRPIFLPYDAQSALGGMNDEGVPFEVIAGLIDHAL